MRSLLFIISLLSAAFTHAEISIEAPAELPAGSSFSVSWQGEGNERDFITIVDVGAEEGTYNAYKYARRPPVDMLAPEEPGRYEIRYLGRDSPYPTLAKSALTVTPVTATVEAPESIDAGAALPVLWSGPDNYHDFITIVPFGEAERKYGKYVYTARGNPAQLRAPDEPGTYEIRYLTGQNYRTLASTTFIVSSTQSSLQFPASVSAGASFEVTWTGPDNAQDYIGLFPGGGSKHDYLSYAYTKKGSPLTMRAPDTPGAYEVRYVTGQSQTSLTTSQLTVNDVTASLDAPEKVEGGAAFHVEWSGPDNFADYIGMVAEQSGEAQPLVEYAYTKYGSPAEMIAPQMPGTYELRYETGQTGRVLHRRAISVTPPVLPPGSLVVTSARSRPANRNAIELILDASGSMLKRQGDRRRIDIAKAVLKDLITETIPAGTPFALRVFGHKEVDSCRTDLEVPLGPLVAVDATASISGIEAMNLARTPIAQSLALIAQDLAAANGAKMIVLITDGEETCDGDPTAEIERLKATGVDVRINIVGFAIDDDALKKTFRYWAESGDGDFFEAADGEALSRSVKAAVREPYRVIAQDGSIVAEGVVDGEPVSVPPGTYAITTAFDSSGAVEVRIQSEKESRIELP